MPPIVLPVCSSGDLLLDKLTSALQEVGCYTKFWCVCERDSSGANVATEEAASMGLSSKAASRFSRSKTDTVPNFDGSATLLQ